MRGLIFDIRILLHIHLFVCASICEFWGRNSVKGGRMKNLGKLEILKNGKMIIIIIIYCHNGSGKCRKFSRSRMMKQTVPLFSSREI